MIPAYECGPVCIDRASQVNDDDPRGIFFAWEPPRRSESYVVSCDPTVGIEGWTRALRTKDDLRTDNCAVEIIRCGKGGKPDVQVAEFAAPIAPYQQAAVLNALGRLYAGNSENQEALMIIEVWPGPGTAVIQPLIHVHGYTNFWTWKYLDQIYPTARNINKWPGWYSTPKSQRDLWLRSQHFISILYGVNPSTGKARCSDFDRWGQPVSEDWVPSTTRGENGILLNSPWLIDEMGDCEIDPSKLRAMAHAGRHEDRWQALSMGMWALHDWTSMLIPDHPEKPAVRTANWQSSDISLDRMNIEWNERFEQLLEDTV